MKYVFYNGYSAVNFSYKNLRSAFIHRFGPVIGEDKFRLFKSLSGDEKKYLMAHSLYDMLKYHRAKYGTVKKPNEKTGEINYRSRKLPDDSLASFIFTEGPLSPMRSNQLKRRESKLADTHNAQGLVGNSALDNLLIDIGHDAYVLGHKGAKDITKSFPGEMFRVKQESSKDPVVILDNSPFHSDRAYLYKNDDNTRVIKLGNDYIYAYPHEKEHYRQVHVPDKDDPINYDTYEHEYAANQALRDYYKSKPWSSPELNKAIAMQAMLSDSSYGVRVMRENLKNLTASDRELIYNDWKKHQDKE